MKILKAKNYIKDIDCPLIEFKVNDIMIIPSLKWLNKRMEKFTKSIEAHGMLWPVIITDLKHYWQKDKNWPKDDKGVHIDGMAVHTGNKRVLYAKLNGYDLIEGYYVKTKSSKDWILAKTFITSENWPT
jgi:hypothetical protein